MSRETDDYDNMPSWNDDNGFADHFDDGNDCSDVEESNTLISAVYKRQDVISKLKAYRERSVQGMEIFLKVVTSIPSVQNHDANSELLDGLEFAKGDASSTWGSVRASLDVHLPSRY